LNIPDLIKEYLRNHEALTVPGLGTFTLLYKPAKINEFSQTMSPPSREVLFNGELKNDDGLFEAFVAKFEELTLDEAKEQITHYVNRVNELLNKGKFVQVSDMGMISKIADKLEFSSLLRENLHKPSFGLTEIRFEKDAATPVSTPTVVEKKEEKPKKVEKEVVVEAKKVEVPVPVKKEKPVKQKVVKEKKVKEKKVRTQHSRKAIYWIVAGAFTAILAVFILLYILTDIPQSFGLPSIKSLTDRFMPAKNDVNVVIPNPVINDTTTQTTVKDTAAVQAVNKGIETDTTAVKVAKVIDMQNCKEKALNPANDTKKKAVAAVGLRYYLIAGSFKNLINAQKLQNDLKKQGYPAELVSDGRTFRISYKSFDTKEAANAEMLAMQKKGIAGIWILSFETK
jgi:cell division protein FtsN